MLIQHPALPWEITDSIIDHLHSDLGALGICSRVCSEWLIRSRCHIFSTVQLWPWRVHRFFELANSPSCTFTRHIHRIELDDLRAKERPRDVRDTLQENDERVLFNEAMAQSHIPCFSRVISMRVENVDWTALSPTQTEKLRGRLAKFSRLSRLEFQGVVFHDLREVIRVVSSFPSLRQLSAHISFLKYPEYAIVSAWTLRLPSNVQTIELGTDDGIPVVLSCLAGNKEKPHLLALKLQNIRCSHLQHISATLERSGSYLQQVSLEFAQETLQTTSLGSSTRISELIGTEPSNLDDLISAVDLSRLGHLRTLCIGGLRIQEKKSLVGIEAALVPILERIESSFLESIDLRFLLDANAAPACFNWKCLERVLLAHHFFGLRLVRVIVLSEEDKQESVEQWIRRAMSDLSSREILVIRVIQAG